MIEGDEYDSAYFDKTAKFLKYLPDVAIVNNIEFDHADIYADLDAVRLAFRRLVNLVPRNGLLLLGADSPDALALAAVGGQPGGDVRARRRRDLAGGEHPHRDGLTHFDVRRDGELFGRFESPLLGVHNVRNALAAIAVGSFAGLDAATLADGLRAFRGIKRRLEIVGVRARRDGARRLRAPSDGGARDAGGAADRLSRIAGSGRCSSRAPPRRAGASSRTTSPAPSRAPTKW